MSSDAELDAKLTALLRVMVSRLPNNKTLPTAVAQQLLRGKYADTYPEAYIAGRADFITATLARLTAEKEKAAAATAAAAAAATSAKPVEDSSDDDDEDSDADSEEDEDSDDDSEEDEDSEWDEEASASGEEEEDEEDDDDDGSSSEADGDDASLGAAAGPEKKRPRTEAEEAEKGTAAPATGSVAERCKAMAECLRKLSYRVRAPAEAESLDAYLQNFLIAEFTKHGMDPDKYGKSDIKRYRIKREVELLQQDGATLDLDRRHRAGRGFAHVAINKESSGASQNNGTPAASAPTRQASMFLDDE